MAGSDGADSGWSEDVFSVTLERNTMLKIIRQIIAEEKSFFSSNPSLQGMDAVEAWLKRQRVMWKSKAYLKAYIPACRRWCQKRQLKRDKIYLSELYAHLNQLPESAHDTFRYKEGLSIGQACRKRILKAEKEISS